MKPKMKPQKNKTGQTYYRFMLDANSDLAEYAITEMEAEDMKPGKWLKMILQERRAKAK